MSAPFRTVVGPAIEFVGGSERRRVLVVIGVPLAFWLAVELTANLGLLPLVLAAGLTAYLYTRETAQATLAAGCAGTGLLLVSLFSLQLYWVGSRGSTELLVGAITRLSGWFLLGAILLALGAWLYTVTPYDE